MSLERRFREMFMRDMFGEEYAEYEEYSTIICELFSASSAQIYMLVEKLSRNCGDYGSELLQQPQVIAVPPQARWKLELGDGVKINCSFAEFKYIQQNTIGWNRKLKGAMDKTGLVMSVCSDRDSDIQVLFPTIDLLCELYAGVLEKVELEGKNGALFKKGDCVVTNATIRIATLLLRGFGDFHKSFLGQVGLVTGVTSSGVHVTFQGSVTHTMNPALLKKTDREYKTKIFAHSKGYKAGYKVRVISNLGKLIKIEEDKWEPNMSGIYGKEVLVVRVRENGSLRICDEKGRSWSLSSESVMPLSQDEKSHKESKEEVKSEEKKEDVPFKLEEYVTLKLKLMTRRILEKESIPFSFLEYLCLPVLVDSYDKKLNARIQYNSTQFVRIKTVFIEKASEEKTSRSAGVVSKLKDLKVGSDVNVDAGPPNYVLSVLGVMGVKGDIVDALTTSGKVLGFLGSGHVVVKYVSGKMYRINRKYLTVPEKYSLDDMKHEIDGDQVLQIVEVLKKSLEAIKKSGEGDDADLSGKYTIDTFSLVRGDPPKLKIHVTSTTHSFDMIYESLAKRPDWRLEKQSQGVYLVKECEMFKNNIILEFHLSNERPLPPPYSPPESPTGEFATKLSVGVTSDIVSGDGEGAKLEVERERLGAQPIYEAAEDPQRYGWLRFGNTSTGRPRFIPYVIGDLEQGGEDTVASGRP